jgi:lambda family phage minor tail protein L
MSELIELVQLQDPGEALIEVFEIALDSSTLFFHAGLDGALANIEFRDHTTPATINTYVAIPIELSGVATASDGASARPTLTIANVLAVFRDALSGEGITTNDDLVGKTLTRRQTLFKYLYGETGDTNPPVEFPIERFIIDRVSSANNLFVSFELAAAYDLERASIPSRVVTGKYCSWIYQGAAIGKGGCLWSSTSDVAVGGNTHTAYFSIDDEPIIPLADFSAFSVSATVDEYNSSGGRYWQCINATSTAPSATDTDWRECRAFTVWSGATAYTNNSTTPQQSDYVEYLNTVWRCSRSHTNETPSNSSKYWIRGDICGKTLSACKVRFQYIPVTGAGDNRNPSNALDTVQTLPFGAFPGSDKFR